jgi:cytochrome P450
VSEGPVTDYDPFVAPHRDDPFPALAKARRDAPVVWCAAESGWMVTRYADCVGVLTDPGTFSSTDLFRRPRGLCAEAQAILDHGYTFEEIRPLTAAAPPEHTRLRGLLAAAFTPRRVAALELPIRSRAHALVDGFAGDGQADLVGRFASPLPLVTIVELLGLPAADVAVLKRWSDDRIALYWADLSAEAQVTCARSLLDLQSYLRAAIEARRRRPVDDFISDLIAAADDDASVPVPKLVGQLMVLVAAGHETTTSLIANGVVLLLTHRAQWEGLCADPARLAPPAVEEILRLDGPAKGFLRTATVDRRLAGVDIQAGDRVRVMMTSANRDDAAFAEPNRFDIFRRERRSHLGFGHGIHFCAGAALARLHGRVALEVLSTRLPSLRLEPDHHLRYEPNANLRILAQLPVEW